MSTTESIFAPYLDRKAKVAVAGIVTFFLTVLLGVALLIGMITNGLLLAPLVPSGPTQYAYLMSVHHALPSWGTWALVYRLSTMPVLAIASWAALIFLSIDTYNVVMAIVRFVYLDVAESAFITQIIIFIVLATYWLTTMLATVWVWRILRFKARRRRTYADVEVEMLRGHRPTKPLSLRGRPSRKPPVRGKVASKFL